jgi:hypothetical protein
MKLECRERLDKDSKEYLFTISGYDFMSLNLDLMDMRLMDECSSSDSMADKLLMLEMLARRYEQQSRPTNQKGV